jgi:hypothetical protein
MPFLFTYRLILQYNWLVRQEKLSPEKDQIRFRH